MVSFLKRNGFIFETKWNGFIFETEWFHFWNRMVSFLKQRK